MTYLTVEPRVARFGFAPPDRNMARRQFRVSMLVLGCFGLASACLLLI